VVSTRVSRSTRGATGRRALVGGTTFIDRIGFAGARPRGFVLASALVIAVVTGAVVTSTATAARGLKTGFADDNVFTADNSSVRNLWLSRAAGARAGIIRITANWRSSVGTSPPANPTNPADPAYHFGRLDEAVKSARSHGLGVLLTVFRAPSWAEDGKRPRKVEPGAWKPDPKKFGQFAQALARRYSGHFLNLPRVRYFEAWSEPNLSQFLAPQWKGKRKVAPRRYRAMLNRFYAGVHAAQPGATVIAGATSSFGDSRKHPLNPARPRMRPLVFLRSVLCLNGHLKRARCKKKPHLDALSAHPLNFSNPPNYVPYSKNDLQVAVFRRVTKTLRAAKRAGTVRPRGHHSLWATEEGLLSNPPNPTGVRPKKHARWLEKSLYLLWKQGASVVVNLQIRDVAYNPRHVPSGQFTTGIYFHSGKPKPALRAWRFPFVTHRKSKRRVSAWGKAPQGGKLRIQQKRHGHWRTRKRITVRAGEVFRPSFRLRGRGTLRAQVGKTKSLSWHQSR
jgi:hypothetical protein